MFYLFIFESLGTSELILIGLVALIVFGPRKIPQLARTIGKTIADLRRATNDFRTTWEREVDLDEIKREVDVEGIKREINFDNLDEDADRKISAGGETPNAGQKSVAQSSRPEAAIAAPEIREISAADLKQHLPANEKAAATEPPQEEASGKRDWL